MNPFLAMVVTNAVMVTALFVVVLACKSRIRNPAVLHCVWLLVLLKLLTPPMWSPQLVLLPAAEPDARPVAVATPVRETVFETDTRPESVHVVRTEPLSTVPRQDSFHGQAPVQSAGHSTTPATTYTAEIPRLDWLLVALIVWAVGASTIWGLSIWRITRLERFLRFAQEAPAEIQQAAAALGDQIGVRRCPRVLQVPGHVSPMLWTLFGPPRIVVPGDLFNQLDGPSQHTLLLHELVHYRRGDQLVRWLELLSLGLYWWHPVAWLLRREIRLAEELACDASVVSHRPDDRRAYAEMLVNTVAFLSANEVPVLATGVGTKSHLEKRLRMIMSSTRGTRISRLVKMFVGMFAISILPLAPILVRAQRAEVKTSTTAQADEMLGTVVDEAGKPVAGIEVQAYLKGLPVNRALKTNDAGQFRVPRSWHSQDRFDDQAVLVVRQGEARLGWLDLGSLLWHDPQKPNPAVMGDGFRIVLLSNTQVVRGTLVDPDGKPLSGIRVAVDGMSHTANWGLNQHGIGQENLPGATTDKDGKFEVKLPADTRAGLEVLHPDWQRRRLSARPENADLGRVTLARAALIQGRVVDGATGKPLPKQRVFAQSLSSHSDQDFVSYGSAWTDADGRYVIGGLSPGQFNVLFGGSEAARAEQRLTAVAVEGVDLQVGKPVQADFQAGAGRRLSGKVLDGETGKPLAKIHVGYYGPARPDSGAACIMVRTKDDGTYEFHVPPGASKVYVAEGNREQHNDSSRTLEVPADRDLIDVVLKAGRKGGTKEAVVEEEPAKPSPQPQAGKAPAPAKFKPYTLHVNLKAPAGLKVNQVDARTAQRGSSYTSQWTALSATGHNVQFNPNEDGRRMLLLINANGFGPVRSKEFVVAERMPELDVELSPEVKVPVKGRLVAKNGDPIAGARIRVARAIHGVENEFPWGLEYVTGTDGRFEVKHARVGDRIQLRVDKAGTGGAESGWLSLDNKEPRTLDDLVMGGFDKEVGGVVLEGNDGSPVANAKIIHTGEPRAETTTDGEGKFRLTGLPAGTVSVAIESAGFPRDTRKVPTGKLDNQIYVERVSSQDKSDYMVTVKLRPRDGKEVQRATLFFGVEKGSIMNWMPERKGNSHVLGFAGEVRRYRDKQFVVYVAADGYAWPQPAIIPNQRKPKEIVFDLEPAAPVTLRGRVLDDAGKPIANAAVGLSIAMHEQENHEPWRYVGLRNKLPTTDVDGKFEIPGILPKSQVAVYVNKSGFAGAWSKRVTVEKPETLNLPDLHLSPATRELTGRVVDEQGKAVADASVFARDITTVETTTDAEGRFRLQHVPDNDALVFVRSESGEWTKKLTADDKTLDVKLSQRP